MQKDIDNDRHILGLFQLEGNDYHGEIIYNRENGHILLSIQYPTKTGMERPLGVIPHITGKLNTGAAVTLYHNMCIRNHTNLFSNQHFVFRSEFFILGEQQEMYNRLTCVLENGLNWSGLSALDLSEYSTVKLKPYDPPEYHWFGSNIRFYTELTNGLFAFPRSEECRVVERLVLEIDSEEKQTVPSLMQLRDKVMSLISFAIKDNINIEEQFLTDFDDYEEFGESKHYNRRSFISFEPYSYPVNTHINDYNFSRAQLSNSEDIQEALTKLEPVFKLYQSLFKYPGMPVEMFFLNIVQALETYHSRFFYNNKKKEYVESVNQRFGTYQDFDHISSLLLNETQMDPNCNYIILVSRLNDLLIGEFNGLFWEFYMEDTTYAQRIADTRHYYTHYGKSKEAIAFRGDDLHDAIYILRLLLEYYICRSLKIDIEEKTRQALGRYFINKVLAEGSENVPLPLS